MKENQLEQTLIDILTKKENQWTYRPDIKTEDAMWENLRHHISRFTILVDDKRSQNISKNRRSQDG